MAAKRKFILSTESINSRGFWIKTAGIQLDRFSKNPIMLWNHNRGWADSTATILPIGYWDNLHIEDGKLMGDPVFSEDDFSQKIAKKVEEGTIRAASIGMEPITLSEEKADLKPGQTRATVVKCNLLEVSIVDIPANSEAVALYRGGKLVELSADTDAEIPILKDYSHDYKIDMKIIALKLGLSDTATEADVIAKITSQETELANIKTERDALKAQVAEMEKTHAAAQTAEADALLADALKAGKIDANGKSAFEILFKQDFNAAKMALQGLPARTTLTSQVQASGGGSALSAKSWDELDRAGRLAELKASDLEAFKVKYKERFGVEPSF